MSKAVSKNTGGKSGAVQGQAAAGSHLIDRSNQAAPMDQLLRLQGKSGNQAIQAWLGSGKPLPESVRGEMETRFETNFDSVRIHDNEIAHRSATLLQAKAFTYGSNIVFGAGRFAPGRQEGRYLLAHELAHVVQQSRGIGTPLVPDDYGQHETSAADAGKAFIGETGSVDVMGSTGVGIARTPEDEIEPDLHKPLKIGETREYLDKGGTTGKASRPTADVFVIETNLRAGQSTIRSDYQTKALPTPEGDVIPLGEGGFEKLHAIGPLLGHESPHGILYGPFRLNRHLMEHGIETYLSQLRDLLPPGAVLRLRVTVQRELGSGRYQGHEFLKSISYSVDQLTPSGLPRPVFRQEIFVDQPQDPNTTYDIGEPRLLINDPLKKVVSPTSKGKRRQRVPDILPTRDQKAARKLFDDLTTLKERLDTLRQPASGIKAATTQIDFYTTELEKALTSIKTPERMTQDELKNLRQLHQDLLEIFPDSQGGSFSKRGSLTAKPRPLPQKVAGQKQSQAEGPTPQTPQGIPPAKESKVQVVTPGEPNTKPTDTLGKTIPGPPIEPGVLPSSKPTPSEVKPPIIQGQPSFPTRSTNPSPISKRMIVTKPPGTRTPWGKTPTRGTIPQKIGGAMGEAGWAAAGEMLGNSLERLNEWGIRNRTNEEVEKLTPKIKAYQEAHPDEGVLIAVLIQTWDPKWRPSDARPTRSFVNIIPQYGGRTKDEALNRWDSVPKFLPGSPEGSTMGTDFIWVPPGQYVSLSKTNFINGRYLSSSDPNRMLIFQFSDDGSFLCESLNRKTFTRFKIEIVKPWRIDLDSNSIKMTAHFYDPIAQTAFKSEFYVLDTESVQEYRTTTGGGEDIFWHKTEEFDYGPK